MKLLALVFLVGFALVSAVPVPSHDLSLKDEDLEYMFALAAEDDPQTELGEKLKQRFDEILEKIKDAIEQGKGVKEEYLEKLKEIREKLKDMKIDVREKSKELLQQLKEKAKDYWKKILDRLGGKEKRSIDMHLEAFMMAEDDETKTELKQKLKERFDELLEKIKDAIENGKVIKEEYLEKAKEIRQKLKELHVELGKQTKDLIEKLKEKAKDYWQRILDRLTGKEERSIDMHVEALMMADDEDVKTELGKKLQEHLDEILTKIKDAIEHGKTVKEETLEKLKEIREKLKGMKQDIGAKAKEIIEKIKEKANDYWQKILDRLGGKEKRSIDMHVEALMLAEDDDIKTELGKKLREQLDDILHKIKDAIEQGKGLKEEYFKQAKEIREKLKDLKMEIGNKAKDLLEQLKEKAKNYWQKILDRLTGKEKRSIDMHVESFMMAEDDDTKTEVGKELKERFEELLEKIKDAIEHGKIVKEDTLQKLKEIRQKLQDMHVELGKHAKELLEKIKNRFRDYLKKILDKLDGKEEVEALMMADDNDEMVNRLQNDLQQLFEKCKEVFGKTHHIPLTILNKMKVVAEKLKQKGAGMGDKAREALDKLFENYPILKKLLDFFPKREQSSMNIRDMLKDLKEKIKDMIDPDKVKEKIEFLFGKHSELTQTLRDMLKEKGEGWKQRIFDFIDKHIPDKEKRSIKDVIDKIKEYFKDLQIELKEKFAKFGEWAKDKYEKGLEKGKTRAENLKKLAREFINEAKDMHKDVAEQAKEFFKEYKDDLGTIYEDLSRKIKEILDRKD